MDPCFRKRTDGTLVLFDSAEAKYFVNKNRAQSTYRPPMSETVVKEAAIKLCLELKGNPKIEKDLFGCYTLQFGMFQNKTFKWILENTPGYAGYLICGMDKDKPDDSARYHNKLAFKKYVFMFEEGRSIVQMKRREKLPNVSTQRVKPSTSILSDDRLLAEVEAIESKMPGVKACSSTTKPQTQQKDQNLNSSVNVSKTGSSQERDKNDPVSNKKKSEKTVVTATTHSSVCLPVGWVKTLPKNDHQWVSKALFKFSGKGRIEMDYSKVDRLWWHPPQPSLTCNNKPKVDRYFTRPLFLWMPRKLWQVKLVCPHEGCDNIALTSAGVYQTVRHVLDVAGGYNMAAEYLECPKCKRKVISWSHNIVSQLDIGHQIQFPCILTAKLACDMKVVRLLRQRGLGNSSSQIQQKLQEQHSEVWLQKNIHYLTDCQSYTRAATSKLLLPAVFEEPPKMLQIPKHRWLMHVYVLDVLQRLDEVKAKITSQFGRVIKIDSTKKVVKKLAGHSAKTAMWATNIGNEFGQVIMSVLTAAEGYGLQPMISGIIQRYSDAGVPPPELLYVDRDCCGSSSIRRMFSKWEKMHICLDIWHFMRRLSVGCNTDSHQLYGTFMSGLSNCIFIWDQDDLEKLKDAKRAELIGQHIRNPTDADVMRNISRDELSLHCKRTTRGTEEVITMISKLIQTFDSDKGRDTLGVPLINSERMKLTWESQIKHVPCIQDPVDAQLYIQTGTSSKGGKTLPVYRCARGSTSLECFHLHLNRFIPGSLANATAFQAYLVDGLSRWNEDRSNAATAQDKECPHSYSGLLKHTANELGESVLGRLITSSYVGPRKFTGELIGIEYLYSQNDKVLQDTNAVISDMQLNKDCDEIGEADQDEDEGFADEFEFQDLTIPNLENRLEISTPLAKSASSCEVKQKILHIPSDAEYKSAMETETDDILTYEEGNTASDTLPVESSERTTPDRKLLDSEVSHGSLSDVDESVGPDNIPGYNKVYDLAENLVGLRSVSQALTMEQANNIIKLWDSLEEYDRRPTVFSPRHKSKLLQGRFRSTKRIVAPGVESARRSFLGPNTGPAQWPDCNRYVEATISMLCDLFPSAHTDGGIRFTRWSLILKNYSHIRQCILGNSRVMEKTSIQLPELNSTTLTQWYNKRGKSQGRQILEQGLDVPKPQASSEKLPAALPKPVYLPTGNTEIHQYVKPANTAGMATTKKRKNSKTTTTTTTTIQAPQESVAASSTDLHLTPFNMCFPNPLDSTIIVRGLNINPFLKQSAETQVLNSVPYTTLRHRKRKLEEEQVGVFRRKYIKKTNVIVCKKCQKERKPPSHQQYFGNWYCQETAEETVSEWKEQLKKRGYGRKKLEEITSPE